MPSIQEWHREAYSAIASNQFSIYSAMPVRHILEFQSAVRVNLGIREESDLAFYKFYRMMDTWDESLIASFIDYFICHLPSVRHDPSLPRDLADELERRLDHGGSTWAVGVINGRYRLVDRVPAGVRATVESVMSREGKSSELLRQSWGKAYGVDKNPSHAYFDAVRAVEVLSCPLFSPADAEPTLGKDINVLRNGIHKFSFVMADSGKSGTSLEKVLAMMQLLWHSQTDRHGKNDYQGVSVEEAQAAVLLASTLIGFFSQGAIKRL